MSEEMYGPFFHWEGYTWLCAECLEKLKELTISFAKQYERLPKHSDLRARMDDDPEFPSMYMYDHRMYCGGHCCAVHAERERNATTTLRT